MDQIDFKDIFNGKYLLTIVFYSTRDLNARVVLSQSSTCLMSQLEIKLVQTWS